MAEPAVPHTFSLPAPQFFATTGAFLALMVVLCLSSLALPRGKRSTLIVVSVGSVCCFWLAWFCTFAMQINPLIAPELTVRG